MIQKTFKGVAGKQKLQPRKYSWTERVGNSLCLQLACEAW